MDNQFKVVRILDEYRIIVNAGITHGITEADRFEIHGIVDTVYDPDTKESLGSFTGIKATVRPVEIFERMSICKNEEIYDNSPLEDALKAISLSMQVTLQPKYLKIPKKLNVDKSQITNPELYEPIQLGDKVVLIKGAKVTQPQSKPSNEEAVETEPKESNQD